MNDFVQLKFPALFSSSCPSDFFPDVHLKKHFIILFLLLFLDISFFVDGQKFSDKILNQPSIAVAVPPHSLYQAQPPILRQDLSALPAIMNADRVSKLLRKIANEEIGVVAMQVYFAEMYTFGSTFLQCCNVFSHIWTTPFTKIENTSIWYRCEK